MKKFTDVFQTKLKDYHQTWQMNLIYAYNNFFFIIIKQTNIQQKVNLFIIINIIHVWGQSNHVKYTSRPPW